MATKEKLQYTDIDTSTLPRNAKAAQAEMKAANQIAATKREHFNTIMAKLLTDTNQVPAGMVPVFSHYFGKLAVAFVPAGSKSAPKPKAEKKAIRF